MRIIQISVVEIDMDGKKAITILGLGSDSLMYEYSRVDGSWILQADDREAVFKPEGTTET